VLEQNFEYDLVGSAKLLQKFIDQVIVVQTQDSQTYTGTLLSAVDNVILQGGQMARSPCSAWSRSATSNFPALPEGLRTRPSLVWLIDAQQAGEHETAVTYLTNGMSWRADYVLLLNEESDAFDLNGWVTLDNRSGASFEDAMLKLVAGDINQVAQQVYQPRCDDDGRSGCYACAGRGAARVLRVSPLPGDAAGDGEGQPNQADRVRRRPETCPRPSSTSTTAGPATRAMATAR
jgi:hypothetical protein